MSRFTHKSSLAFILAIAVTVSAAGQLSSKEIDHLVEDAMEKFTVAGVAVGIVKDGKIIHARGYGVKSVDTNDPVDAHTAFAIASNSKAFTTTALTMLVEEGKLSWADRVIDHIPEFKMYNDYVTQNFNIQDLVTHRSGLGLGAEMLGCHHRDTDSGGERLIGWPGQTPSAEAGQGRLKS